MFLLEFTEVDLLIFHPSSSCNWVNFYCKMHALLENFSTFSWSDILESEEKCISFLEDLELIPRKTDQLVCPVCGGSMSTMKNKNYKAGWLWTCKNQTSDQKPCSGTVKPLENTFFESNRVPLRDFVGIIFCFILGMDVRRISEQVGYWRLRRRENRIGSRTILDIFNKCKKIGAIIAVHSGEQIENLEEAFEVYCEKFMHALPNYGDKVYQFLMDIKSVYPGYGKKGLACEVSNLCVMSSLLSVSGDNLHDLSGSTENLDVSTSCAGMDDSVSSTRDH